MRNWIPPILLTLLWVVVLAILCTPESPHGHGFTHPQIAEMDRGGAGLERHGSVLVLGWLFGSVLIALFVGLLAHGTLPRQRYKVAVFVLGLLLYEGVFGMLCLTYGASLDNPQTPLFWGPFPAATSWLLFGVWLAPFFFIALYVVFFDRWVMPPDHAKRFEELVEETRQSRS